MKKLLGILLIVLALASCESKLPVQQTKFIVERIDRGSTVSYYRLVSNKNENLNVSSTWICDSIGKFNTGDTLVFVKISK